MSDMVATGQIPLKDHRLLTDLFLSVYKIEAEKMIGIVTARDDSGRNAAVPLPEMFLHGVDTIVDILHMKLQRVRGNLVVGREDLAQEELRDIANYSLFGVVLLGDEVDK